VDDCSNHVLPQHPASWAALWHQLPLEALEVSCVVDRPPDFDKRASPVNRLGLRRAALVRVHDDAADATVGLDRRLLQCIFGTRRAGEPGPEPVADPDAAGRCGCRSARRQHPDRAAQRDHCREPRRSAIPPQGVAAPGCGGRGGRPERPERQNLHTASRFFPRGRIGIASGGSVCRLRSRFGRHESPAGALIAAAAIRCLSGATFVASPRGYCAGQAVLCRHYLVGVTRITDSACSASLRCVCSMGK
jgi:hypothetical protein